MKVVFSTSMVHARDRLDHWRKAASKASALHEFSSSAGAAFQGSISVGVLGSLPVTIFDCDACQAERTERCIGRSSDDDLLLVSPLSGRMSFRQDGREGRLGPGDMVLMEPRRPAFVEVSCPTRSLLIRVPRWELQDRLGAVSAFTSRMISQESALGALASGFLALIPDRIGGLDRVSGEKIAQQALDLVALAFSAEAAGRPVALSTSRRATLLRIKQIIENRLCDPGLRPATVAKAAGISVRYANALLAVEDTSLERFIVIRRLERCRRLLEDPAQAPSTVGEIAFACGFSDLSHFSRRFKARFGVSPRECRGRLATDEQRTQP